MPYIRNRHSCLSSGGKKINTSSDRPRNILVTVASPHLRDLVLSATHRFDKAHPKNMLNSKHVDIAGESRRIYITKHVCHGCKEIHADARKYARENNHKYVWVKFGQMHSHRDDSGSALRIRDIDFFNKLHK
ncbi:hypothetical protein EVAR_93582_1 [Eumeta japonica]|uniref:FP protein C-terminal domain-containing protein n=1 Tax=Eumeta variegata TaxID=151549 RepID=A0A4C1USD4_EUMVA|nr:hypothetical protein EVAR_93582_1 [Eumeta japonica]